MKRVVAVLSVLAASTAYAVVRYNVFGGVSVANLPAYVLNKSVSVSAVCFLLLAALSRLRKRDEA